MRLHGGRWRLLVPRTCLGRAKKRKAAAVVDYEDASGALSAAALQTLGFEVGVHTKNTKTGIVYIIKNIDIDKQEVKLETTGDDVDKASSSSGKEEAVMATFGELLDAYEIYKPSTPVWILAGDMPKPPVIKDARLDFTKAAIKMSMSHVWDDIGPQPVDVLVTAKGKHPSFRIFAQAVVPKRKLELMAYGTQVGATTEQVPSSVHDLGVEVARGIDTYKLYVSQPKMAIPKTVAVQLDLPDEGIPFVVPFWLVRQTQHSANVNAEVITKTYEVVVSGMSTKTMFKFSVPLITNSKAMKAGEELLLHKVETVLTPPPKHVIKQGSKKAAAQPNKVR